MRAQNQASGTLRRVGNDLSALGRKEALAGRRAALNLQRGNLLNKQQKIRNDLEKQLTGTAAMNARQQQRALEEEALGHSRVLKQRQAALKIAQEEQKIARTRLRRFGGPTADPLSVAGMQQAVRRADKAAMTATHGIEASTRALAKNGVVATRSGKVWRELGNAVQLAQQKFPYTRTAQDSLNKSTAEASIRQAELRQNLFANRQALEQNAQKFKQLAQSERAFKMERIGQATHLLSSMGRQLQLIGGAGAAALGFAANSAANLSSQATLAATQLGNNIKNVRKVSDANFSAIIADMRQFPAASDDMASALYDIFSTLNVGGKAGRDILVQLNKAAVGGALSVKDAGAGVLSVLSNFKDIPQTGVGVEKALTRMFAAVRFGRMTMAEFAQTLQTTAPAAKQSQQSFDTLAGTMAFLSRSLGPAKAAVGFARLTEVLGGSQMEKGLKAVGVSLKDANGDFLPLNKQIDILVKRFPYLARGGSKALNFFKEIGNIQGTIQARRAFVTLTKDTEGYNKILNATINDNNEFEKSFNAMNETAGVQFARALNVLKSLWLELGKAAIPTIAGLLSPIGDLADKLSHMDQATKDSIGRIVAMSVAIAGITGVVLSAAGAFGGLLLIFTTLDGGVLLGISAGVLGIAAAVMLVIQNWDSVKPRLVKYWPDIQNAIQSAVGGIQNILEKVSGFVKDLIQVTDALIRGDWGDLWNSAGNAVGNFSDVVTIALRGLADVFTGWLDLSTSSVQGFVAGMLILSVTSVKVIGALRALKVGFDGVAIAASRAEIAAGGAGKMGLFASIGNIAGNVVGRVKTLTTGARLMGLAFSEAGGGAVGLRAALGVLMGALGPTGIVLAVGAAAAGLYLLLSSFDRTKSAADKLRDSIEAVGSAARAVGSGMQDLLGTTVTGRDQALSIRSAKLDLQSSLKYLSEQKKGTLEYKYALLDVARARNSLADAESAGVKTRQADATAVQEQIKNAQKLITEIHKQRGLPAAVRRVAAQPLMAAQPGDTQLRAGAIRQHNKEIMDARELMDKWTKSTADNRQELATALSAYNEMVARGINPFSKGMTELRHKLVQSTGGLNGWSDQAIVDIKGISDELGRVPTAPEIKFIVDNKKARDGIEAFMRIAHKVPSQQVVDIILEHRNAEVQVGAWLAKFHRIPTKKMFSLLSNIPKVAIPQFVAWLRTLDKMPSRKQVRVEVKGIEQANKKVATLARIAAQRHRIQFDTHSAVADAGKVENAGKKAAKDRKGRIHLYFQPSVSQIIASGNTIATGLKGGILSDAVWGTLGTELADKVNAQIDIANSNIKRLKGIRSPSKLWAKEIGKPLGQGVIQGVQMANVGPGIAKLILDGIDFAGMKAKEKKKAIADAMKQAMDTAVSTLQSKWQEIHDLNVQNFGELFQSEGITTKIDWGQKLNIRDLQADLRTQLTTFRTFNSSLVRLQRRGGPQSLIDQLRQLGPSAQGELNALNGATKGQLRTYLRTWNQSQRAINKATKQQFRSQIREWRNQGRAIAAGIILGLRQEGPQMQAYFRRLFRNLITTARKSNRSHSPSLLYAEEGRNIVAGLRLGMQKESQGMTVPMPGLGRMGRLQSGGAGGTVINQTNHFHNSESALTALQKANFRLKHR